MSGRLPVEPIFDQTPQLFGDGPPDPIIYDASPAELRRRRVNFTAKRYADMMFVSGLDRATADRHFRLRAASVPAGLDARPVGPDLPTQAQAPFAAGRLVIETDSEDRRARVRWTDPSSPAPFVGSAVARPGYGSILLGP